jgi:iron complex transport system substrate-binding protein
MRKAWLFAGLVLVLACARERGTARRAEDKRAPPERIVSLSPSATEILYGIGAFDRVVAVSNYCTYPPEVERLPRVGNWLSANMEQLASLRADLIIMSDAQAHFLQSRLSALGVRTLVVESQTLPDAFHAIAAIGRAVARERQAAELERATRARIEDVRNRARGLARPGVICIVDRVPGTLRDLYTATEGSFIAELIEAAGGRSVAPRAGTGYGKITKEALLVINPDIIIDMVQGAKGRLGEDPRRVWNELSDLAAVQSGRVYSLEETSLLHPSQFVAETARRFAEIMHPEVFGHGDRP